MRSYPGLTGRMASLMACIEGYVEANGYGPSFDEMREAMGLRAKSGIHRMITALEERGYIQRLPHRARSIEVLKPSLPPIVRITVELDGTGRFVRLLCPETRPVVMVRNATWNSTRPATEAEVAA